MESNVSSCNFFVSFVSFVVRRPSKGSQTAANSEEID